MASAAAQNIHYVFSYLDYSDIVVSRNFLISNFYFNHPECSHLLFVDADTGFDAALVTEMLALGEDVVGALYPKRRIDLEKLHAARDLPFKQALANAAEFIGKVHRPIERRGNFIRVDHCGTGVLLISRNCIEKMINALPELVDEKRFKRMPFVSQFKKFITPFDKIRDEGAEYSEDFSFCKRWVEDCGGAIWAHTDRNIRHTGTIVVDTRYLDKATPL